MIPQLVLPIIIGLLEFFSHQAFAFRLPKAVIPEVYTVNITTDLEESDHPFTFYGDVNIQVRIADRTDTIQMHCKDLNINFNDLKVLKGNSKIYVQSSNLRSDFLYVKLGEAENANTVLNINIPFSGELKDDFVGYHRSSYADPDSNDAKYLAVTEGSQNNARRLFPCFDEPEMKATFKVSLGHHKKYTALSNMPAAGVEPVGDSDYVRTVFDDTPKMSTYIVAFAISDFVPVKLGKVNCWSRPDAVNELEFAVGLGSKALSYFEKFFSLPYKLPKLDIFAVPEYALGATENWGLITFPEASLLYEAAISDIEIMQKIADVMTRVIAHQWFGNLVTMKWWDDYWLNEGFATYLGIECIESLYPNWNHIHEERLNTFMKIFDMDGLVSTLPISEDITYIDRIKELGDGITYDKGARLIKMVKNIVGAPAFQTGISNYLKNHQYGSVTQDDLWDEITSSAKNAVRVLNNTRLADVMRTWTTQAGCPVINVIRNYRTGDVEVTQNRFYLDRDDGKVTPSHWWISNLNPKSNATEYWWIPLTYTDASSLKFSDTTPQMMMPNSQDPIKIKGPRERDWIIFNVQGADIYRVNYDERNWNLLSDYLRSRRYRNIPELNRVQLLIDSCALGWSEKLDYRIFFKLLGFLKQETSFVVWKAALTALEKIEEAVKPSLDFPIFQDFMKKFLAKAYSVHGGLSKIITNVANKANADKMKLQTLIREKSCLFQVDACIKDARLLFNQFRYVKNRLSSSIRSIVLGTAVALGLDRDWNTVWQEFENARSTAEKKGLLASLASTTSSQLLQNLLEKTLIPNNYISVEDIPHIFSQMCQRESGLEHARQFFTDNLERIPSAIWGECVLSMGFAMNTQEYKEWLGDLVKSNIAGWAGSIQTVIRVMESIDLRAKWRMANEGKMSLYVAEAQFYFSFSVSL